MGADPAARKLDSLANGVVKNESRDPAVSTATSIPVSLFRIMIGMRIGGPMAE
jgi:hypothetical protein